MAPQIRLYHIMAKVWVFTAAMLPFASAIAQTPEYAPPSSPLWQGIFARPETIRAPADNPLTNAKIMLGEQLFFDKRLSGDGRRNCATCHMPEKGYSDGRTSSEGLNGKPLTRNTPALWNLAWAPHFYWDGRKPTLEDQARVPIEHANEMGGDLAAASKVLNRDEKMEAVFAAAFPDSPYASERTILAAIASYERALISPVTRFDRWIDGEAGTLTMQEYRGFQLFTGRAGCLACHGGWRFTDDKFHDIGLSTKDPGRSAVDGGPGRALRFKTPGLRGVQQSAPYMHNGSMASLEDVLSHYAGGFMRRPSLAPTFVKNLKLSAQERAELIAFLKAL